MSRPPQQPSIRSFFQPRAQPSYAAPPSSSPDSSGAPLPSTPNDTTSSTPQPAAAPLAPPLPTVPESQKQQQHQQQLQQQQQVNAPAGVERPITIPITLPPQIPVLPSPPSLPSGATIVPLAEHHIPALRRINSLLLPVAYPDSFYAKILEPLVSGLFSRAILWQDTPSDTPKVIGGLVCRLEPNLFLDARTGQPIPSRPPSTKPEPQAAAITTPYHSIYIQSLTLLSPYRSLGLAAAALDHIIASAALLPEAGASIDARTIYAHVWTENEDGLRWYESRGFTRHGAEPVKGYYFKLRPDTAWVVKRDIYSTSLSSPAPPPPPSSALPLSARPTRSTVAAAINLPPTPPPATMGSAASSSTPSSTAPPRRPPPPPSASSSTTSLSYQTAKPETEWNDLPAEMMSKSQTLAPHPPPPSSLTPPHHPHHPGSASGSGPASGASSRSSSTVRKKKERAYPTAAFGN
ncbi:hypothetical protein QBC44DRAFT_148963 [Cladorrhinum sp. PSN332]|nr:hypothetical protein QBC44DRAFT_148963 [Cladorrhinum sp. PSN332]